MFHLKTKLNNVSIVCAVVGMNKSIFKFLRPIYAERKRKCKGKCSLVFVMYYRPQRSCGKVMFLHLSVILFTGGRGCSVHAGIHTPLVRHPPGQTPWTEHPSLGWHPRQTPLAWADNPTWAGTPIDRPSPPLPASRWLLLRTVRILLECILVL